MNSANSKNFAEFDKPARSVILVPQEESAAVLQAGRSLKFFCMSPDRYGDGMVDREFLAQLSQ